MPKVSVVVPNYNHARFLRQRIDSILAQTYQDFELILLDDCSTDDSRSILREYASDPHVTHLEFNEMNSGSTFKQWNKGVRLARGEYVWIAESDDYADPRFLETLVPRLESDTRVVLAQCRSWRVSGDGELEGFQNSRLDLGTNRWGADFSADGREECRRFLFRSCSVQSTSSVVFRREVYWKVGGADETLRQCGDWKMWAAMALTGGVISYVAEPLNYYRSHEMTVTQRYIRTPSNGVWAAESLHVTAWILKRVTPHETLLQGLRDQVSGLWTAAVLSAEIPVGRRRKILKDAMAVDPHAIRRLLNAFRQKMKYRASTPWYRLLDATYSFRHAIGLNRRSVKQDKGEARTGDTR